MVVNVAGAYVREAAYRRAESDFSPLSIGGRKSRAPGLQTRAAKSMTTWFSTTAESRQHAHHDCRTASRPPAWQVRSGVPAPSHREVRAAERTASAKVLAVQAHPIGRCWPLRPNIRGLGGRLPAPNHRTVQANERRTSDQPQTSSRLEKSSLSPKTSSTAGC